MTRHSAPGTTRHGVVAVYVACCLPALLAVVALAIDAGLLYEMKRRCRSAADASALAAAGDLFQSYTNAPLFDDGTDAGGSIKAHALEIAAANGFTNDGQESVVTVNIPPKSGPFTDQLGYVEVIVEYRLKRGFSALFASDRIPVRARAVARGRWAPSGMGILCLDPISAASLKVQGQCFGEVPAAAVIVNSSSANAADGGGQGGTLTSKSFEITGGYNQSGGEQFIGPIHTGVPPTPDPYRTLAEPDPSTMLLYKQNDWSKWYEDLGGGLKRYTLKPGCYEGGLSFSGQDTVILEPGIYYMKGGGFHFSGTESTSLTALGVMLFNGTGTNGRAGDISITGSSTVTWTPPSSGIYRGMSFFQARSVTQTIGISGGGSMNVKGAWYAQNAMIDIGGSGTNYVGSQFVCWNMFMHGNGTYIVPWDAGNLMPVRDLKLVE
jgi:hypothetical protein